MRIITFIILPITQQGALLLEGIPIRRLECWGSAAAARILHSQPREISSRSLPSPAVYSQHTRRMQPRCGAQVVRFNTPYRKSSRYTTRTRLSLSRDLIHQADLENCRDQMIVNRRDSALAGN